MKWILSISIMASFMIACNGQNKSEEQEMDLEVKKTEEQWKQELTPEQYYVLRQQGTERPHTGEYNLHFEEGVYTCTGCGAELFSSDAKFESHCGWPSFDKALDQNTVVEKLDRSHGMIRTEIVCAKCGGHLGHVFNDGPTKTGMRYCINSVSLGFEAEKEEGKTESEK